MRKLFTSRFFYLLSATVLLLTATLSCKKEDTNPLLACRPSNGGSGNGISAGTSVSRTIMFWIDHDFGCGALKLVSIRNTETNDTYYSGATNATITRYAATQPACGTTGFITIQVAKGYEYEYTIACTGRQWQAKVTADCSDDCIAIQLK